MFEIEDERYTIVKIARGYVRGLSGVIANFINEECEEQCMLKLKAEITEIPGDELRETD